MNLSKAVFSVSALTLVSRVTGLVRDQIGAHYFGTSAMMDAFQIAFRIPNLLRRLFAEGAFSQAFVPLLAATRAEQGDEATHALVDAVATVLTWALVGVCLLGIAGAPLLVWALASGFDARTHEASVAMTRWMFPYIGCMSLVALSAGVLNTWRRFGVPAFTPVLLNLSVIVAAWLGVPVLRAHGIEPIYAMAWGAMAGGVLQLAIQVPALWRLGMLPRIAGSPSGLARSWRHPGVGRMLSKMGPALIGVSVSQLSLLINSQIASHLGEGAVSGLTYADRLMELPSALLGVALGVVLTPSLSAASARRDRAHYSELLDWGLRLVLLLGLPCAVALAVFAQPMVATLFHRGAFDAAAVSRTAPAVAAYGIGLVGLVAVKVLAPGYFAQQDMRTPMRIGIAVLLLTQVLNALFVPWLGMPALALSIGLAATVNAGWLAWGLHRRGDFTLSAGWLAFAARVVVATSAMGVGLWWCGRAVDWLSLGHNEAMRAAAMAAAIVAACTVYFVVLRATGLDLKPLLRRHA